MRVYLDTSAELRESTVIATRRYGDLQGLNKAETTNKFGEEQAVACGRVERHCSRVASDAFR